jgi:bifunctional oligoribonuclease and PAP phosphatase NrnA
MILENIAEKIIAAHSVVLTTHRNCDGDGLGAQLALFHGLNRLGKSVRILNVDQPPAKYSFLEIEKWIEVYSSALAIEVNSAPLAPTDVALIFDTNDGRLVEPLFSDLKKKCKNVFFIDHHPILLEGPAPTSGSFIDVGAASTGEISYRLLKLLGVTLDAQIARALYTSIAFDTQLFRYVKTDPASHVMAAELLKYERHPEEIHRRLFATYTVERMALLSTALSRVEYFAGNQLAFIGLRLKDFKDAHTLPGFDADDSADIIDMVMNIESIQVAALIREDSPGHFKLSMRSKGAIEVVGMAEGFGGGGHRFASGAYINSDYDSLRASLRTELQKHLETYLASIANDPTAAIKPKAGT